MKPRQSRRGRLTRSAEFERVYKRGSSCANRQLVLYWFANTSAEMPRVGLSVSRRVGGAVERNRVKRVLREAVASMRDEVRSGYDIVVVARPELLQLAESEGLKGVADSLAVLLDRAGIAERKAEAGAQERLRRAA